MDQNTGPLLEEFQLKLAETASQTPATISDTERIEVVHYPEDLGDIQPDETNEAIEQILRVVQENEQTRRAPQTNIPLGYVSNARNSAAQSDAFQFWAPAEEASLGIGGIVRHTTLHPDPVHTYGIITKTEGQTLGLDDYATHVYEKDAQPPIESIQPAPSERRPVVNYHVKVLASTQSVQKPVLSGPVYAVSADELAEVHKKQKTRWLDPSYILAGFYQDTTGDFGIFAEERSRVLGPKQGHVILSGSPGAGKTSLFLTLVISLYAQLQNMENGDE
jgi:hypothetical protein